MMTHKKALALYIHWPFCLAKCPYCDFNSHVADRIDPDAWAEGFEAALDSTYEEVGERRITSIFFGGGTPSLMAPRVLERILNKIDLRWGLTKDIEITMEANPTSVEATRFRAYRSAGVNRLSLGIQSLTDDALKFLGRAHTAGEAKKAIATAQSLFDRTSFDLIYAHALHTVDRWEAELKEALMMAGDHLSLYQLTLEPGTAFHTRAKRGEVLTVADDMAATLFELTQATMDQAGMPAYEISNHARHGAESRHNLTYWHYDDYAGIGPGAHGRLVMDNVRVATVDYRNPETWLAMTKQHGHGREGFDVIDRKTAQQEALMMGLRLATGIDRAAWEEKFESDILGDITITHQQRLMDEGWLIINPTHLFLTPTGRQRLNSLLGYFTVN